MIQARCSSCPTWMTTVSFCANVKTGDPDLHTPCATLVNEDLVLKYVFIRAYSLYFNY